MFKKKLNSISLLVAIIFSAHFLADAQKSSPTPKKRPPASSKPNMKPSSASPKDSSEEKQFELAKNQADPIEKINALRKFISDFSGSKYKGQSYELLVSTLAQLGDEKLQRGEIGDGILFLKSAIKDAQNPVSDRLLRNVLLLIPSNLMFRGQPAASAEASAMIEEKISGNADQLLLLAKLYLSFEDGPNAKRIAEKAMILAPNSFEVYQTLGAANRVSFDLPEAERNFSKAIELAPDSLAAQKSIAEIKRGLGKAQEAEALYREILLKESGDLSANNGLIIALFENGKIKEAEDALAKSLEAKPENPLLLAGAAYWYAANNNAAKAIEFGTRAVELEPRYVWGHIALARGLLLEKRPLDAEKRLLIARNYGSFPTLNYEIAAARLQAGFYWEAAVELAKAFRISDGMIQANLGNRVPQKSKTFIELLAAERRVSIFQPLAADDPLNSERLKNLLNFAEKLDLKEPDEAEVSQAADDFIKGEDSSRAHRILFSAKLMLEKNVGLPKVVALVQASISGVDAAAAAPNASAAALADELSDNRALAISRGQYLEVPEIPKPVVLNIMRGRIEEIAGWALFKQSKFPEAITRLKRAVSIFPEKSVWLRNSQWKLGSAFEANGNQKEALDFYVKSYKASGPNAVRYSIIENAYQKVNGKIDGLIDLIGEKPQGFGEGNSGVASVVKGQPEAAPEPKVEEPKPLPGPEIAMPEKSPSPEIKPDVTPGAEPKESPKPSEALPSPDAQPAAEKSEPAKTPEITPSPSPVEAPSPESKPEPEKIPEVAPTQTPEPAPASTPPTGPKPGASPPEKINPEEKVEIKPAPSEKPDEKLPAENEMAPSQSVKVMPSPTPRPLFPPVIIEVGKPQKLPETAPEKVPEKSPEKLPEDKAAENAGGERPRIVEEGVEKAPECSLELSQDSISIINNGGSLGILVAIQGIGKVDDIKAQADSKDDIEVIAEKEIVKDSNKGFFVIRSVSPKLGEFKVTFESPCGKKELLVKVR